MRRIYFILILIVACTTACLKSLDDYRIDPEAVNGAQPSSFLSNTLYTLTTTVIRAGHTTNNQLMQVAATKNNGNGPDRYRILPSVFTVFWNPLYKQLCNIETMLDLAQKRNDVNYEAIAYTLKAWAGSILTDTHGDIPFSNALLGAEQNTTPVFDTQQQVYDSLLVYLERANTLYNVNKVLSGEDLLFNANQNVANVLKWKKFTNALHLRLLMRIAHKSTVYADQLKAMLADPGKYPLMNSVSDGASLYYTNIIPFQNPYYSTRDFDFNGSDNYAKFFIDYLKEVQDPRLPVWATKTGSTYSGIPTGFPLSQQDAISGTVFSTYQLGLKTSSYLGSILQYAEQEFLLAEACLNGYMADDAKKHYNNGIAASCSYWGVTSIPDAFLSHPKVAYNGTMEQIITQKYFALFENGFEQWFEYRRTGFPVLNKGEEMYNDGVMPSRLCYPNTELTFNRANYLDVVKRIGKDDINTKVWWQQR
jgi:hypothetical protein